jgi:hypothetical protein
MGPTHPRRCLMCSKKFVSEGRHNRICRKCKSSQIWREGSLGSARVAGDK